MVELAFLCLELLCTKTSICVTLHLLCVLLIQLHDVVVVVVVVVVKRIGKIYAKTPFALTAVSRLPAS